MKKSLLAISIALSSACFSSVVIADETRSANSDEEIVCVQVQMNGDLVTLSDSLLTAADATGTAGAVGVLGAAGAAGTEKTASE